MTRDDLIEAMDQAAVESCQAYRLNVPEDRGRRLVMPAVLALLHARLPGLSEVIAGRAVIVPRGTLETVKRISSYRATQGGLGSAHSEEYRRGCNDMAAWIEEEIAAVLKDFAD